jgi:hypothetical protein
MGMIELQRCNCNFDDERLGFGKAGKTRIDGKPFDSMSRYPYSVVEAALGELFRAKTESQRRTLRGRINHLQRLGVIDAAPGKGQALQYEQDHIWRWVFCFELAEYGVTPAVQAALVASYWKPVLGGIFRSALRAVETGKPDVFLYIRGPALMSAAWNQEPHRFAGVPHIGKFTASDFGLVLEWLEKDERTPPRLSIVNLSARLRVLNKALASAQKLSERA